MDKKQTPNYQKLASGSKFAKPRGQRLDANTTLAGHGTHNLSTTRTRSLNYTGRQNLDSTIASVGCSNIKSNASPSINSTELGCDLAYNNYLQALMKQQLAKKTIEEHKVKLNDQILIQSEHLHKLENTFHDISNEIDNLKEQSDIVELLQMLEWGISEIETSCSRYNTFSQLSDLNQILKIKSNLVSVRNIKLLNSQEEYNKLVSSLTDLKNVLQKIVEGEKHFKEVNELASSLRGFNELHKVVHMAMQKLNKSNENAAALLLKESSDLFARKGGYF